MNDKWKKLIEQFKDAGYRPEDIQRIVMVYEMVRENDEFLKGLKEKESLLSE